MRWYKLRGNYAAALVAASSEAEAERLANEHESAQVWGPWVEPRLCECPGPPSAVGVYHCFGE